MSVVVYAVEVVVPRQTAQIDRQVVGSVWLTRAVVGESGPPEGLSLFFAQRETNEVAEELDASRSPRGE